MWFGLGCDVVLDAEYLDYRIVVVIRGKDVGKLVAIEICAV